MCEVFAVKDLDTGAVHDISDVSSDQFSSFNTKSSEGARKPSTDLQITKFLNQKFSPTYESMEPVKTISDCGSGIRKVIFHSKTLASLRESNTIGIYSVVGGDIQYVRSISFNYRIVDICWMETDSYLVIASEHEITVINVDGAESDTVLRTNGTITSVTACQTLILSCNLCNSVDIWSVKDKERVHSLEFMASPVCAAFSPDNRRIAVGCSNSMCYVYEDLRYVMQFHVGTKDVGMFSMMFADSDSILIEADDSRVRLYNIKNGELIRKYIGFHNSKKLGSISMSSDRRTFMVISDKKPSVYFYPVDHASSFKSSLIASNIKNDRSKTFDGFTIGSKAELSSSVFCCEMCVASDASGCLHIVRL